MTPDSHWDEVVSLVTRSFSGVGASLYTPFAPMFGHDLLWSTNADPEYVSAYASKYARNDIIFLALLKRIPSPPFVYRFDDMADRDAIEKWDGYRDLLAPRGVHQGIGMLVNTEDHRACQLTVYKSAIDGPEVDEVVQAFGRLQGHFTRAVRIHWHLAESRRTADTAMITLDMFGAGVAWLSDSGEVLYANKEMERILALNDGINLSSGRLNLLDSRDSEGFLSALRTAATGGDSSISVSRLSGLASFRINVMPLPMHATALRLPRAAAIVFISEGRKPTQGAVEAIAKMHNLTPAECRVLEEIASGTDVQQISRRNGTSVATVRTQVKAILSKCGVSRQADLVRIVALMPQLRSV